MDGQALALLQEVRQDIGELKTSMVEVKGFLMGPPEAPYVGFVARTESHINDHGKQISELEKLNIGPRLAEHSTRIRWAEGKIFMWLGALGVIVLVINYAVNHIK